MLFLCPQWAGNPPYSLQLGAVSLFSKLPEHLSLLPSYSCDFFRIFYRDYKSINFLRIETASTLFCIFHVTRDCVLPRSAQKYTLNTMFHQPPPLPTPYLLYSELSFLLG